LYCAGCLRIAFEAETDDERGTDQQDAQKRRRNERTERHEVQRIHKIHAKCHDTLPERPKQADHGFIATADLNSMRAAGRWHRRRVSYANAEIRRCRAQRREKSN
jgi:hypothetical protein